MAPMVPQAEDAMTQWRRNFRSAFFGGVPPMAPSTPLGHNRCELCGTLSPLYQLWPSCRSCSEDICSACQVAGSYDEETNRCDCKACAATEVLTPADAFARDHSLLAIYLKDTWHVSPEDKERLYTAIAGEAFDDGTLVRISRWAREMAWCESGDLRARLDWLMDWCDQQLARIVNGKAGQ